MYDDFGGTVEGDMTVPNSRKSRNPGNEPEFNTLDEPIRDTVASVMILQGSAEKADSSNDGGPEFAEVFVIVWIGSMIVTLNSKLLGGNISFFQSVCVLGYCLLPTAIALIVCRIILLVEQSTLLFTIRFVITMVGFGWATFGGKVERQLLSLGQQKELISIIRPQTVLLQNLYVNPQNSAKSADGSHLLLSDNPADRSLFARLVANVSDEEMQEHYDNFFEDVFVECEDKYGEIEEMNVCDNLGDHLVGNVYIKFRREEDAEKAVSDLNNRWFGGRPVYAELSPVTDFREACCRQYEMGLVPCL
ncbi:Splicing factor U2af 38 kDa subunit [Cryptotermes secundus]|uniref:Protein YIPF n=1 Tax=Cryptotermes secundus TaxID=105785 RepID=A0A2J7PN18_9NEOP|nr:Splicing factor U2af 38 kDa subunit [Cryptotermes secundus]